jgi:hypothetical protein
MSNYLDVVKKNLREYFFEALSEDEITAEQIHDILIEEVVSLVEYHESKLSKARQTYDLLTAGKDCISFESHESFPNYVNFDFMGNLGDSSSLYSDDHVDTTNTIKFTNYTDDELNSMCDAAEKKENKKYTVPVEIDEVSGEHFLIFPDELIEQVQWQENDELEWIDMKNGVFEIRKVEKTDVRSQK